MRSMIILIILGGALLVGGFVVLNFKNVASNTTQYDNPAVTLTGTVKLTTTTVEYSYLLLGSDKSTPITSSKIDIKKYVDKKVAVVGQYSGSTLYVDQIRELP